MKICIIGAGYVGLVGAAIFAEWGNDVIGVDIDGEKINRLRKGDIPIYEPGLSEIVLENVKDGRLNFTTRLKTGMDGADLVFICVGTPQGHDGAADLFAVWKAAEDVGRNLTDGKYKVVVTKSTVPAGTNERIEMIIRKTAPKNAKFDVASNPEFLREGTSVEDMLSPDRTIVGARTQRAFRVLRRLYSHLEAPIVECDLRSAEMIKYASNAFLATKISFINEMAQLCEKAGADVEKVAHGMGLDHRIGPKFLTAGIGYGGSCFPKDVSALRRTSLDFAYDFSLISGVMRVNDVQKHYFCGKIYQEFSEKLHGKTFAVLGLAFKNNTDDVRESVAIKVIHLLRGRGAKLRVYDPVAMGNARKEVGGVQIYYAKDEYDAMKGADALCLLTEWDEFRALDLKKVKKALKGRYIFDGRNLLNKDEAEKAGFIYHCIGKRTKAYREEIYIPSVVLNGR